MAASMDDTPCTSAVELDAQNDVGHPLCNYAPARDWHRQPCMMGIDEAGRGPVLGPMVYACVVAALEYKDDLKKKPYADSKTLSEAQREELFALVRADARLVYSADVLSAQHISVRMLARSKVSLNEVAALSTIGLIQGALDAGIQLQQVFIDTVGDPQRYAQRLQRSFPGLAFTVCPKADALYPIVSAASIVAKVTRDAALHRAAVAAAAAAPAPPPRSAGNAGAAAQGDPAGAKLGSGYPHDADTQAWLRSNVSPVFGFPPLVRFSWETAVRALEEGGAVRVDWEADEPPDMANQPSLASFVAVGPGAESSGAGRHSYFRIRRLQRVPAF